MAHSQTQTVLVNQLRKGLETLSIQFRPGQSEITIGLIKRKLPIAASIVDKVLESLTQDNTWNQVGTLNTAMTKLITTIAELHIDQKK